jgi:hypothetical protein
MFMQKRIENGPEPAVPKQARLLTRDPENSILVENFAGYVTIRAARDNFCARRKAFFIRHLAAEGYIPDRFERLGEPGSALRDIRWIIDPAQRASRDSVKRETDRFMVRSLAGIFVLWLALMVLLFLRAL